MNTDARTPARSKSKTKSDSAALSREAKAAAAGAKRTWFVLGGLAVALASTGAFLKVTAPRPLAAESESLYAVGASEPINQVFDTPITIEQGRWKSIFVHHSLTPTGNAQTLAVDDEGPSDHFLIGNGDPLADGAIQSGPRWSRQQPAGSVPGVKIRSDCISICLVGDFNAERPSPLQQARLLELLTALQKQLGISSENVVIGFPSAETTIAGVGRRFPVQALRDQLLQP